MNLVALSQRIQALRKERKMTLQELASRSSLTRSLLSKVENFRVTPSLPALARIASALGVTVSVLVEGLEERPRIVIVRKGERESVRRDRPGSKLLYRTLAHKRSAKAMDPFLIELPPGRGRKQMLAHEGEEFLMVLAGKVDYGHGDTVYRLSRGDCAYADGNVKHRLINCGKSPAQVLVVYSRGS